MTLTYRIGEISLFAKRFSGCANSAHFTDVVPYSSVPQPLQIPANCPDFLFYPAYPVNFDPPPIASSGDWLLYTPYTFNNCYVDLKRLDSFDAYLRTFSSKSRSTLQRKVKKFIEADGGKLNWREFTRPDEIEEFISLAKTVSAKSYQERLLHEGLPTTPEFITEAKARAASAGVYAYILFLHNQPVSYVFCFCTNGIATYDYVGYDPAFASLSSGTVLQYTILQSLFNGNRVEIFDFTEGEGQHKSLFKTDEQRCAKTYFFRRGLKILFLVYLHFHLNRGVECIGRLLEKAGLKATIRRLIRRAA